MIKENLRGFTLVELSIVIVIIGLLIGGILIGKSLVSSTQINGVIREYAQYEAAIRLFHARFKGLPGDSTKATTIFGFGSGNGDGATTPTWEVYFAWRQLSYSGLIPNKANTANGHYSGTLQTLPGVDTPLSTVFKKAVWSFDGNKSTNQGSGALGWNMYYTGDENKGRTQLRLAQYRAGTSSTHSLLYVGPLTVEQVKAIDSKADDGKPGTGNIGHHTANTSMIYCATGTNQTTATYDLSITGDGCHVAFWLPEF